MTNGGTAPVLGQAAGGVPGMAAAAPEDAPVTGAAAGPASLAQLPAGMVAAGMPGAAAAGDAGAAAAGAALPPQAVSVLAAAERAKNRPLVCMHEATLLLRKFNAGASTVRDTRAVAGRRLCSCP